MRFIFFLALLLAVPLSVGCAGTSAFKPTASNPRQVGHNVTVEIDAKGSTIVSTGAGPVFSVNVKNGNANGDQAKDYALDGKANMNSPGGEVSTQEGLKAPPEAEKPAEGLKDTGHPAIDAPEVSDLDEAFDALFR